MSEFNEPWWYDVDWGKVRDDLHKIVLDSVLPGAESINRNRFRQRIIACVNACAGIPTADLERARQFMPTLAAPLSAEQKAELLNVLEKSPPSAVVAIPEGMECKPKPFAAGTTASEAIQKLRDAGLDAWDKIEDPEAFIRELRSEEPAPLVWRKEPPDRPGWWWLRRHGNEVSMAMIFWSELNELFSATCHGYYDPVSVSDSWFRDCEWAGPIEPPTSTK